MRSVTTKKETVHRMAERAEVHQGFDGAEVWLDEDGLVHLALDAAKLETAFEMKIERGTAEDLRLRELLGVASPELPLVAMHSTEVAPGLLAWQVGENAEGKLIYDDLADGTLAVIGDSSQARSLLALANHQIGTRGAVKFLLADPESAFPAGQWNVLHTDDLGEVIAQGINALEERQQAQRVENDPLVVMLDLGKRADSLSQEETENLVRLAMQGRAVNLHLVISLFDDLDGMSQVFRQILVARVGRIGPGSDLVAGTARVNDQTIRVLNPISGPRGPKFSLPRLIGRSEEVYTMLGKTRINPGDVVKILCGDNVLLTASAARTLLDEILVKRGAATIRLHGASGEPLERVIDDARAHGLHTRITYSVYRR